MKNETVSTAADQLWLGTLP